MTKCDQKAIRGNVNISSERRAFAEKRCPLFVDSALKITIEAMPNVNETPEEFKRLSAKCQEAGRSESCFSRRDFQVTYEQLTTTRWPRHMTRMLFNLIATNLRALLMPSS
jgi:hypothetical protein